eukprot:6159196-Pyramimonas_sp.AAC.1
MSGLVGANAPNWGIAWLILLHSKHDAPLPSGSSMSRHGHAAAMRRQSTATCRPLEHYVRLVPLLPRILERRRQHLNVSRTMYDACSDG